MSYSSVTPEIIRELVYLIEAMRNKFSLKGEEITNNSYKSYFISERFERDYRNKKWSLGIGVVIDGLPFQISGNDTVEKLKVFMNKVDQATSVSLSKETHYEVAEQSLDTEQLRVVFHALFPSPSIPPNELSLVVNDIGKRVTFTLTYTTALSARPSIIGEPKIFGGKIVNGELFNERSIDRPIQILVLRNAEETVELYFETSLGPISRVAIIPDQFKLPVISGFKVGDILFSILNEADFITEHGADWSLLAGDAINIPSGSKLRNYLQNRSLPDARGVFLRGKQNGRNEGGNPSGELEIGAFQPDEFKNHSHDASWPYGHGGGNVNQINANRGHQGGAEYYHSQSVGVAPTGGNETRPANITVNVFVKIT